MEARAPKPPLLDRLRAVRALVLDVDGILTDGRLHFTEHGTEHKVFHSRDGHGIKLAQRIGIEVAIISGRASPALHHRAQNLGIRHCLTGIARKGDALVDLCATLSLAPAQCAVMGDDVIDLPMLAAAGVSATVADAPAAIRHRVDWVTRLPGGHGAVREFIELLIDAQDQWPAILSDHDPRDQRPIGAA